MGVCPCYILLGMVSSLARESKRRKEFMGTVCYMKLGKVRWLKPNGVKRIDLGQWLISAPFYFDVTFEVTSRGALWRPKGPREVSR